MPFQCLRKGIFLFGERAPLQVTLRGNLDKGWSVTLDKGTVNLLGSEVTLAGKCSHIFSEQGYLLLDSTLLFNGPQLASHCPGIMDGNWGVDIPRAINLSVQGPLKTLFLKADCNLKGFDFKSPYFSLEEPLADGAIQVEAALVNKGDIKIHTFMVRLKQSHVVLSGKINTSNAGAPEAYLEARGTVIAEEVLPLLQEPLPATFSLKGTSLLHAVLRGNPAKAFTLEAALDLTDSFWEDPFLVSKKKGVKNRVAVSFSRDYSTNRLAGTGDFALEGAHMDFSFRYPSSDPHSLYAELSIPPFELSELTTLKLYQAGESFGGKITLDLNASINPSHVLESSVEGFIEIDDFSASVNGLAVSAEAQVVAEGNRIEVPYLDVQYGNSDLDVWQTVFSWGDVPKIEIYAFSRSLNLKELMPVSKEKALEDESSGENVSEAEGNVLWQLLEWEPDLDIDLSIGTLFVGHRDVRDAHLLLTGDKGLFTIVSTFQTGDGKSSIRAEVQGPFANQCIQENIQFDINGFNMTELAKLLEWEKPPFTGVVYADGELIHLSNPKKRWINPESVDGRVNIRFEEGAIRELAIITNMLSIMRYPITLAIPVVRWIFLSDVALNWWKRRSITTLSRTMPYDVIEGSFVLDDGLVTTEDLVLRGEVLNMAAALTMDMLDENALSGLVVSRYYSTVGNLIGWMPLVGDWWIDMQDRFIANRFVVSGTLGKPKVESVTWKNLKEGTRGTFNVLSDSMRPKR